MKMGLFFSQPKKPEAGSAEPVSISHSRPRDRPLSPCFAPSARWLSPTGSSPWDSHRAASPPGRKERGGAGGLLGRRSQRPFLRMQILFVFHWPEWGHVAP